jgi:hypothetical protein
MFIGRMLGATGIGMRYPDCRKAKHLRKDIIRQRSAKIWKYGWDPNLPIWTDDGCNGMSKLDTRIGKESTPIPRVMSTLPRIY